MWVRTLLDTLRSHRDDRINAVKDIKAELDKVNATNDTKAEQIKDLKASLAETQQVLLWEGRGLFCVRMFECTCSECVYMSICS